MEEMKNSSTTEPINMNLLQKELEEVETKYASIIEELKRKNEDVQRLKENALVMTGAKAILTKLIGSKP